MSGEKLAGGVVRRKLEESDVPDPLEGSSREDPWQDFRRIEVIDFKLDFQFRHSLGKCSRFFLELEHRRLLGTRCPKCAALWMPPRPVCGNDLTVTEWVEVPGRGVLAAATECAYTLKGAIAGVADNGAAKGDGAAAPAEPLMLGYVALEGASTLLLQRIRNYGGDARRLQAGLQMRVAWTDGPVDHPMELFWFEPVGEAPSSAP